MIFAELKLKDCVVRIPFVCRQCGKCCRILSKIVFDPVEKKIYMENIEEISKHVSMDELIEELSRKIDAKHPVKLPCPFLKDDRCSIHPIRPKSCRVFPLGKELDQGIGCPGLKRLMELTSAFNAESLEFKFVEGDIEKTKVSKEVFEKFLSLSPSDEEIELFFKLNELGTSERSHHKADKSHLSLLSER